LSGVEAKRQSNIRRHGIDFAELEKVFAGETPALWNDRYDYGERRLLTLGLLRGSVGAVFHTETDEVVRIISARKALKDEEVTYFNEIRN
jgi:uncharacterized DUF497 family protein